MSVAEECYVWVHSFHSSSFLVCDVWPKNVGFGYASPRVLPYSNSWETRELSSMNVPLIQQT